MEHDGLHIEYNDVSLLASGASKHACMKSRMVVHVAVGTVYSRVLGVLLVKLEDMLDPLGTDDLLLWRELISLGNWTWNC